MITVTNPPRLLSAAIAHWNRYIKGAAIATALLVVLPTAVFGQSGPAQVAYAWANNSTAAVYTPTSGYAYSPTGTIQVQRSSTGSYNVVFAGLGALTDSQLGGLANVQVTAFGSTAGWCKLNSWGAQTDFSASVQCYGNDGQLADTRFLIQVLLPGSNPVDLGFAYADQPTSASYTANKSWAYSSGGRDVTITRSAAGLYVVSVSGITAFSTPGTGSGGHIQVTAVGSTSEHCQVSSWGASGSNLNVSVRCYTNQVLADSPFSVLVMGPNTDMGGLGFAWANNSTSASYTPNSAYSFNESTGAITATRTGTGVYSVDFATLSTYAGLFAGGAGHVQVTTYGTSPAYCTAVIASTTTADVYCYVGIGEFHAPVDTQFDVLFLYRQIKAKDQGVLGFDAYADGQVVTTVSGEPISFPDGIEIEQCSTSGPNCVRAWSGDKVAYGQIGFEFDREPIVMEFSALQKVVSAHVNSFNQNGQARTVTLTAKNSNGGVIGTSVETFDAAPAWGTRISFTQPQPLDPASIARVEITSSSNTDWVYIDDVGYDDVVLPVELASFAGLVDGSNVLFQWETLSELGVAGFAVQRATNDGWQPVSEVVAATSPNGGTYSWRLTSTTLGAAVFRLAAIDVDGSVGYSETIEVSIELASDYAVSPAYPNPFADRTTVGVSVREAQHVRVELYNLLGRRVLLAADELFAADERRDVVIDAAALPSGTYFVRVSGETFSEARSVVIAR